MTRGSALSAANGSASASRPVAEEEPLGLDVDCAAPSVRRAQSRTWLTMPSASFGSNQVDFGGMIPPASATAIRSAICVG